MLNNDPNMINVGTETAPLYIPKNSSAADLGMPLGNIFSGGNQAQYKVVSNDVNGIPIIKGTGGLPQRSGDLLYTTNKKVGQTKFSNLKDLISQYGVDKVYAADVGGGDIEYRLRPGSSVVNPNAPAGVNQPSNQLLTAPQVEPLGVNKEPIKITETYTNDKGETMEVAKNADTAAMAKLGWKPQTQQVSTGVNQPLLTQPETSALASGGEKKFIPLAPSALLSGTALKESDIARTTGTNIYRRDLEAEKAKIGEFIKEYGKNPQSKEDWAFFHDYVYEGKSPTEALKTQTGQAGLQAGGQLTQQQELLAAQDRITKGTANQTDKDNVAYAQKTRLSDIKADPTGTFLYGKKIAEDKVAEVAGIKSGEAGAGAGAGGGTTGGTGGTNGLLSSSSVAQSRQEVLDKMDELAGAKKTVKEEANKTYGLEEKYATMKDLKTQYAEKEAEWNKKLGYNRNSPVDMRVIEGNEAELLRQKNLDLLPLTQMMQIEQGDYEHAEKMAQEYADDLYDAKKLELDKLKTELEFLSEDEEKKYKEAQDKLEERKSMAKNGYVYISDPSQLKKLSPDQIIKIPNANGVDDIYKIPEAEKEYDTKFETAGGRNLMITYDKQGNIVKQTDLGGAYKGTTGGGGTSTTTEKQATSDMMNKLKTVTGSDGFISPDDYLKARNAWIAEGFNPTTFDSQFKGFQNPNNPNYVTDKTSSSRIQF